MTNKKRFLISVASLQLLTLSLGAFAVAGDEGLPEIVSQYKQAQAKLSSTETHAAALTTLSKLYTKLMQGSWDSPLAKEFVRTQRIWDNTSKKDKAKWAAAEKDRNTALKALLNGEAAVVVTHSNIPAETQQARPAYLSADKLPRAFKYFSVKVKDQAAQINGTVYKQCADKFQFVPVTTMSEGNGEYVGYQIIDRAGGLACVDEADKAVAACGTSLNLTKECSFDYVELKNLVGTNLQLPGSGTALIGLQTLDGSKPSDMTSFADFPGGRVKYTSPAQRQIDEYNSTVTGWDNDYRNCRHSLDELDIARVSLGSLVNVGKGPGNIDVALKMLNVDQMEVYKSMIAKAKTKEDLADLRQKVLDYSAENPVGLSADDFATLMQQIAGRYANDKSFGSDRFKLADAAITDAEGIPGLSGERQAGLQNNHTEVGVARMVALSDDGFYGNTALASYLGSKDYAAFTKQLSKYMNQACGNKGSAESCISARSAASSVVQIQTGLQQNFYNPQASPQAQMMAQVAQHQSAAPTFGPSYGATGGQNSFSPMASSYGAMGNGFNSGMNTSFSPMGSQGNGAMWLGGTYGNTGGMGSSGTPMIRSNFGT